MIQVREYGAAGPFLIVLHGGPGAPGHMAPVARQLSNSFRVLEPLQRGSGGQPLTVDCHLQDLQEVVESYCPPERPALLGSSWGAMLALAYAAKYPQSAGPLVLVGCGTFDSAARQRMHATVNERMTEDLRKQLDLLERNAANENQRLQVMGKLLDPLYSYDAIGVQEEPESFDARAFEETWNDMLRLQRQGVYPAAFSAIRSPVLMLHGAYDPHPGKMVHASLQPYIPQLEYVEWERCGHYPWLEKEVRDTFFSVVREWLSKSIPQCNA